MSTSLEEIRRRINALAVDGNVDVDDVELALRSLWADEVLTPEEKGLLSEALTSLADSLEPAARRYIEDRLAGRAPVLVGRVLMGPVPRGGQPDIYQPRAEVVRLQESLKNLGLSVVVDGAYGPMTAASIKLLQHDLGRPETGLVDTHTLLGLNERLRAHGLAALDLTPRARIRPDQVLAMKNGTNKADNVAVQEALAALSRHYGDAALEVTADGQFGAKTEAAVMALQRRWYLPETGIVDGASVEAINTALGVAGLPPISLKGGTGASAVELHFYPGDHQLKVYVRRGGRLLDTYGMVGGRSVAMDDPQSDVDFSPSPAGSYDIIEVSPHVAASWAWSYIPYGAELRDAGGRVIEYRDGSGAWRKVTGPESIFAGRNPPPLEYDDYLGSDGQVVPYWVFNDFGHLRGRLRSRRTGNVQTHMIHSSPDQERTKAYFADTAGLLEPTDAMRRLRHSHGCEHVHPRDVDEMVSKGYLQPGSVFVIHGYDESPS